MGCQRVLGVKGLRWSSALLMRLLQLPTLRRLLFLICVGLASVATVLLARYRRVLWLLLLLGVRALLMLW